jgi:very-short-patch-repair endonuclease
MSPKLTNVARLLRKNSTEIERLLWRHLRAGRFDGYKFKRQQPLGSYVVDFVCFEARLVIELDGGQHADSEADCHRDGWLKEQGFNVLRFWNNDVLTNLEGVLQRTHVELPPSPQPSPVKGEGAIEESLP